jgi:hypothetical protein
VRQPRQRIATRSFHQGSSVFQHARFQVVSAELVETVGEHPEWLRPRQRRQRRNDRRRRAHRHVQLRVHGETRRRACEVNVPHNVAELVRLILRRDRRRIDKHGCLVCGIVERSRQYSQPMPVEADWDVVLIRGIVRHAEVHVGDLTRVLVNE